ncbi:hypothetical protein VTL71DRAFT_4940 [Oculimacula yallundae]|uniref:Uncharacterized protein n=1 Tax=Oculimacula yallundae TaxID=86028 RepID=A0ABR4C4L5_9HELO
MDLLPATVVVKHFVTHSFTFEIGPSITSLGRPIRNTILAAVVIYCIGDIVRGSLQAVLKSSSSKIDTEDKD